MITLITNGAPTHEYGVKSLVAYLQAHDIPVRAIYMNYCRAIHTRLKKQILDIVKGSDIVGFSLMTKDVSIFMPIIQEIRQALNIPVVSGGIHPTARPEETLAFSDFVCIGEGEEPLRQLYLAVRNTTAFDTIPNIGYKDKDGNIRINDVTYFVKDLNELPYPDYEFATSYYYDQIRIKTITPEIRSRCFDSLYFYAQRGCKLACTYCSNSIYSRLARQCKQRWYRIASADRIMDELKTHLKKFPNVKILTFNDDDFLARDIEELKKIAQFVKRELKIPFTVNGVPAFVTEEKIRLLVESGLVGVAFGVQSGSPRILKEVYRRPVTIDSVLKTTEIFSKFHEHHLNADYGFILDNPYEEKYEWLETLHVIRALGKPRTISLYSLAFFPGTTLTQKALKDQKIDPKCFSEDEKDYRSDIRYSFKNTMIFLYSYFEVPLWLSALLLSRFMLYSKLAMPFRFLLAYPLGYVIRMSNNIAPANRERFFLVKLLRKNWIVRAVKYKLHSMREREKLCVT